MRHPILLPSTRKAGALLVSLVGVFLLMLTLQTGIAGASSPPTHDSLGGAYVGEQDGVGFRMTLRQEGRFVTGSVQFGDHSDRLFGIITGQQLAMARISQPFEVWTATIDLPTLRGEWISAEGSGRWHAEQRHARLALTNIVEPATIRTGVTTEDVRYTITVENPGTMTAQDVVLRDYGIPSFFQITGITIDRDGASILAQELRTGVSVVLPLGEIPPGGRVTVQIIGDARPRERGVFLNLAVAAGSNTGRVAARTALTVLPQSSICDRLSDHASDTETNDRAPDETRLDASVCRIAPTDVRPDIRPDSPTEVGTTDDRVGATDRSVRDQASDTEPDDTDRPLRDER